MLIDRELAAGGFPQVFALMFADAAALNAQPEGGAATEPALASAARMVCTAADVLEGVEAAEADGVLDSKEVQGLFLQLERLQSQMAPLRRALHARGVVPISPRSKRGQQ